MSDTWIKQFPDKDQSTAARLIDSLQFFDLASLESELRTNLDRIPAGSPCALFPLMDKNVAQAAPKVGYLDLLSQRQLLQPRPEVPENLADSEYVILHFIRNYCQHEANMINVPIRSEFKRKRVRRIAVVTDLIASGTQVDWFVKYLFQDPTIKSYLSYGLIEKLYIVSHIATKTAIQRLKNLRIYHKPIISELLYSHVGRTIDSYFSDEKERQRVREFCIHFGSGKYTLGFDDTGLLTGYSHKLPNNLPNVLWGSRNAQPHFANRRAENFHPVHQRQFHQESDFVIRNALEILAQSRSNFAERLSEQLSIKITEARSLFLALKQAGYVTRTGSLSLTGHQLLRKLRTNVRADYVQLDHQLRQRYYPQYKGR